MGLIGRGRAMCAAMIACLLLAACGGGGGASQPTAAPTAPAAETVSQRLDREADASRLAKQATFGATPAIIERIRSVGTTAWIDEQLAASGSSFADIAADKKASNFCGSDAQCSRRYYTREPAAMRFYVNAVSQPDQLRQRVAFALGQLLVASTVDTNNASGAAAYQQLLLDNAFGSYRTLLSAVTLNGFMGNYLNLANSSRTNPNENYAREMLQLFSMGTDKLNMDGTPVKDAGGATIANYTSDDVRGISRALTGWTYAHFDGTDSVYTNDYAVPMVPRAASYDTAAKSFLGTTVAAGASQVDSVAAAVDAAFNNASTPPYIAKFLIRHLVTANPSPAYVGRVAAVFANNGQNVRGDMKAVVRAILTDAEARGRARNDDGAGKVREPVLLMTALARAIGITTDGAVFMARDTALGQAVLQSPSVFNFYPPDFPLTQSTTLVSPASRLLTSGTIVARSNLVWDWTIGAATDRADFAARADIAGTTGSRFDWSGWEAFGDNVDGMIDRIDLLLTSREMTDAEKAALKAAALALTRGDPALQARVRVQVMLYVVATSPLFQVDR